METNYSVQEKDKVKVKKPKDYKVVMHNDDYTTMQFVVEILITIFNKTHEQANKLMLDVHKVGKGIAGVYSYDVAMTKAQKAMSLAALEGFPFRLTVEEV